MGQPTIRMNRPPWAALLLLAGAAPALRAQPTVSLELRADDVYVNEPFVLTVRVDNFATCDPPVFPELPRCSVRPLAGGTDSSQTLIVNGRTTVTRARTYSFELTPLAAGELVIPALAVRADDRTLTTEPRRLVVRTSDAEALLAVEISSARQRLYVGQRARLTLTIWVKPARVQNQQLGIRDMLGLLRGQFGPFPTGGIRTDTRPRTGPDGTSASYYTYETWTDYVPDRPGRLTFDDVEIALQYPTRLSRDIFGRWEVSAVRNLRARPAVPAIEVLPLPANGRPPNFSGAVGAYTIVVTARPVTVRVGDPIELAIELRGDGPIETLPPPDLAGDPRLTAAFRVPREELAGESSGGRKRFTQTIRAERADVTEIPAIEYAYFDPDMERYVVALSQPIPITVLPAAELDPANLAAAPTPAAGASRPPLQALDGLRGNETRELELLRSDSPVGIRGIAGVVSAPAAAFVAAWACSAYVQTRRPGLRRRRHARHAARQRIDRAGRLPLRECAAEIVAALANYLGDRLDQPAGRFPGRAAIEFLRNHRVERSTVDRWERLLDRCEQAAFGGTTEVDPAALVEQGRACLRALERERL